MTESAPIGTIVHKLHAVDPDVAHEDDLRYEITVPILAIDSNGKTVNNTTEFEVLSQTSSVAENNVIRFDV